VKERQVISRLIEREKGVLSTGGGAYMAEENREIISKKGVAVWLNADLDVLWQRVRHKDTRPLLRGPDPFGTLKRIYNERVPVYALADLSVKSEQGLSIDDMALRVIDALKTRPDVLEVLE
jgi:shikimate kinase